MINFLKQSLANFQTGNQFVIGFQAGFSLMLLLILLYHYLPIPQANNNQNLDKRVLAAETKLLTPSPTFTPTPTPSSTPTQVKPRPTLIPTLKVYLQKVIVVTATPIQPTSAVQTKTKTQTTNSANQSVNSLLNIINSERAAHGASALTLDGTISACALSHSQQMASSHGLSHNLSVDACAPGYKSLAENVGESTQIPDQAIVTINNSMMGEGPGGGHYENIINSVYKVIGIGIYFDGTTTWVTEDFEG